MYPRHVARCVLMLIAASGSATTLAAPYSFVKIAGASGNPNALSQAVAINNLGGIAFSRTSPNGVQTLFTGGGGGLTKIADNAGPNKYISGWDINRNGVVAYHVEFDYYTPVPYIEATGIFTGDGKINRLVAKSSDRIFRVSGAAINDNGQVALDTASEPLGGITTVVTRYPDRLIAASEGDNLAAGDINNQGVVAFSTSTGQEQMFIGSGGRPTVIAKTEGTDFFFFLSGPRINDAGVVAFKARLDNDGQGVYIASKTAVRTIIDNLSGPFAGFGFGSPAINNRGVVAFEANKNEFHAIYTGTDANANRVIQTGDPLDGSTVLDLSTGSHGRYLNDAGQVAFWAKLTDGRTGIYRANPLQISIAAVPEPSTLMMLMFATAGWCLRRRRAA